MEFKSGAPRNNREGKTVISDETIEQWSREVLTVKDKHVLSRFGIPKGTEIPEEYQRELEEALIKYGPELVKKIVKQDYEERPDADLEDTQESIKQLAWHDFFHGVVEYERSEGKHFGSQFFDKDSVKDNINDELQTREEMEALFWDIVITQKYNLFTSLLSKEGVKNLRFKIIERHLEKDGDGFIEPHTYDDRNSQLRAQGAKNTAAQLDLLESEIVLNGSASFENVLSTYQSIVLQATRSANYGLINQLDVSPEKKRSLENEYDEMVERIIASPSQSMVDRAKRIFEAYPTNKLVLLEEAINVFRKFKTESSKEEGEEIIS